MTQQHLHIVTLDVPLPADYGGMIDVFYKIKALYKIGVNIHLHCFMYGRVQQDELNKYCASVTYYERAKNLKSFSLNTPFIVKSRKCKSLFNNLKKDDYPILLEGIHCTYHLKKLQAANRKIFVRLHNTEFQYYRQLAKNETNFFRRLYFLHESRLLKKYEASISNAAIFFALSKDDLGLYRQLFNATDINFLPAFQPYAFITGKEGVGTFCLYHGNLAINENEGAVKWLLTSVFKDSTAPFIIAGKNPSKSLVRFIEQYPHVCLIANPSENELQDLIAKAHIHILPSLNATGVKLKLLNALFNGRHCLVNKAAVDGSGVEKYCHIATDGASFKEKIDALHQQPFTEQEKENRQGLLNTMYNNEENAKMITEFF